jgi:ABC-type multidrug transport system ATPase subunit
MAPCIEIHNLRKVYRKNTIALEDITLSINSGMYGLLGPNGAGKTTLLRILATLIRPTSGSVEIDGHSINQPDSKWKIRRILGYLPQELALYDDLTALEFLEFIAALKRIAPGARRQGIHHSIEVTGLTSVSRRPLKTFSGGMKRRVGIAQALIGEPKLIIVDEPTAGLDPEERVRFRNLLAGLADRRTILLSTHIVEDVAQTCSQLAVLRRGVLVFVGAVDEMVRQVDGKVWEFESSRNHPLSPNEILVASVPGLTETRYRVLSDVQPQSAARSVSPTLEDAYLWLMQTG